MNTSAAANHNIGAKPLKKDNTNRAATGHSLGGGMVLGPCSASSSDALCGLSPFDALGEVRRQRDGITTA